MVSLDPDFLRTQEEVDEILTRIEQERQRLSCNVVVVGFKNGNGDYHRILSEAEAIREKKMRGSEYIFEILNPCDYENLKKNLPSYIKTL